MPDRSPMLVVLAPDVLGHSFDDAACARVLVAWRDGVVMPALNRQLLQVYLQVLRKLGLGDVLLRRWGWWFTAPGRVRFLERENFTGANGWSLCAEVAKATGADCVIALGVPVLAGVRGAEAEVGGGLMLRWTTPQAFGAGQSP